MSAKPSSHQVVAVAFLFLQLQRHAIAHFDQQIPLCASIYVSFGFNVCEKRDDHSKN